MTVLGAARCLVCVLRASMHPKAQIKAHHRMRTPKLHDLLWLVVPVALLSTIMIRSRKILNTPYFVMLTHVVKVFMLWGYSYIQATGPYVVHRQGAGVSVSPGVACLALCVALGCRVPRAVHSGTAEHQTQTVR